MSWADSGVEKIAESVYRVPLPLPDDGLRAVNTYAIEHSAGIALIDSGWPTPESRRALEGSLRELGAGLSDVTQFLVTHVHRDHYAQGVVLREEFGMTLSLGAGEKDGLRAIRKSTERWETQIPLLLTAGAGDLVDAVHRAPDPPVVAEEWRDPDHWLADGAEIDLTGRTLRVIATPGHTRGHVVFADFSNGLMFSGDHILPHITPSIGFESGLSPTLPLSQYLSSLDLMLRLPEMTMLPAHGETRPGFHGRVCELQQHHAQRLSATALAVHGAERTAYEVARQLPWTKRERAFAELDTFNQILATLETQAHLDVLVERGDLSVNADHQAAVYRNAASPLAKEN